MTHQVKLSRHERIIAVVPEYCAGPGWSNKLLNIYIANSDGGLRVVHLQPQEQTEAQHLIFRAAEAMHQAMLSTVAVKEAAR